MTEAFYGPTGTFAGAMGKLWTAPRAEGGLGLVESGVLSDYWTSFGTALHAAEPCRPRKWGVVVAPTGSGKSVAACLYSALNHGNGVLICTRLTDEADLLADTINRFAASPTIMGAARASTSPIAFSYHSMMKDRPEPFTLAKWPV